MELCDLLENHLIPKEEMDRVFTESYSASAEMDASFLCFDDQYREIRDNTSKDKIILDLGCAYAPQSYYFTDFKKYIGVDLPMGFGDEIRFDRTENSEFYIMSIQDFIKDVLPTLPYDLETIVAICNYVPDEQAQQMVIDTFPNHYVYYPSGIKDITIDIEKSNEEEIERD